MGNGGSIPALCGETPKICYLRKIESGLSPRVRGNRVCALVDGHRVGSIPACAGKPGYPMKMENVGAVYPRVCGETSWRGLSPRVRGNPTAIVNALVYLRSIPACAGKPVSYSSRTTWRAVYPRVCGETCSRSPQPVMTYGLSPRVRGNLEAHGAGVYPHRSIPACAGKPPVTIPQIPGIGVYPRVCGETGVVSVRQSLEYGLSPRVRGNLAPPMQSPQARGSIPACAGKPYPDRSGTPPTAVYPRVCGETCPGPPRPVSTMGLSPRVRGNQWKERNGAASIGSIPACAGKPEPQF